MTAIQTEPPLGRTQEYLKQIVYGGNDGIVTTFAIVAGFAGANAEGAAGFGALAILVFGLANLFADGVSMGLGEFLSMRSARDLYQTRLAQTRERLQRDGRHTVERLSQLFRARGLPPDRAEVVARAIAEDTETSAEFLLSFDTGLGKPHSEGAVASGMVTFLAFLAFGFVPLLPYFFLPAETSTQWLSTVATFTALTALGLLRWNATGETLVRSVGETVFVGGTCSAVAFAVGLLVGA